jgi:hypothetical protein
LDARGDVSGEPFDVIIAINHLEREADPRRFLDGLKPFLCPGGYVIASVANVAHATVRLALLAGYFSPGGDDERDPPALHHYTLASLTRLVESAGFGLGYLERQEAAINVSTSPAGHLRITEEIMAQLGRDLEARTAEFLIIAYPIPWVGLAWLPRRLHTLVVERDAAVREAVALREDLAGVEEHVNLLIQQQKSAVHRETELRTSLVALHQQLTARDQELCQLQRGQGVVARASLAGLLQALRKRYRERLPGRLYRGLRRLLAQPRT